MNLLDDAVPSSQPADLLENQQETPGLVFDFDTSLPKTEDIINKPQGEFDFDVPSEPDILTGNQQQTLDEMLTIEQRKSEQEKTDKIQDFVMK